MKKKTTFPPLPTRICASPYNDFFVSVIKSNDSPSLGHYHTGKDEIVIHPDQPIDLQWVILIHELLHFCEEQMKRSGIIKRRVPHEFIATGANLLFGTLGMSGLIAGLDPEDAKRAVKRWIEENELKEPPIQHQV